MYQLSGHSQIIDNDEELTVLRDQPVGTTPPVTYVDGKPVRNQALLEFTVRCNVQPVDGRDLLLVPEGDRFKEQYWLYANELEKRLVVNDRVQRFDPTLRDYANYQVQSVETWGEPPRGYQRVRIMRIDVGTYRTP